MYKYVFVVTNGPDVSQVMKAVDHPHCIKLYDVFEDREKCYLVSP